MINRAIEELLDASSQKTGGGNSASTLNTEDADSVEVFVDVTLNAGTLKVFLDAGVVAGKYASQGDTGDITTTGVFSVGVARAGNKALGKVMRARWTLSGGNATFEVRAVKKVIGG